MTNLSNVKVLTPHDMDKELKRGKSYCLRLLSLRPRSEYEIDIRLKDKGYAGDLRKVLLGSLKKEGLVNDLEFAKEWIDWRLRSSPRAKRMIKAELRKKGVPESIVEEAIGNKYEKIDERVIARSLLRKKLSGEKESSSLKLKGKLYWFLDSKGFDEEVIEDILNEEI